MTGHSPQTQAFFLPGSTGNLFALYFAPQRPVAVPRGILFFPPFAEEVNKSRRMVALQARRFAAAGYAVLLLDVFGTGDSAGDFGEARWEIWRDDVSRAARWLVDHGCAQLTFWGLRSGALLAADRLGDCDVPVERLLLWQPVVRGEQLMTQFLRLRLAADLMKQGEKTTTQELRASLSAGQSVEVAGYLLAPDLVACIDRLELKTLLRGNTPPVQWLEVVPATERPLSPASRAVIEHWQQQGITVRADCVAGEPFWNTPEITVVPALLERTDQWTAE